MTKKLWKVINKENNKTIAWFTDSEDLFHLADWYNNSDIKYKVEEYELIDVW